MLDRRRKFCPVCCRMLVYKVRTVTTVHRRGPGKYQQKYLYCEICGQGWRIQKVKSTL